MESKVGVRLGRLINIAYLAVVLGIAYLFIKYCLGTVFPFILAFFLAMIVQKPTNAIYKKTKRLKGLTSTVLVLLMFIVLAVVMSVIGTGVVSGVKELGAFVAAKVNDFPQFVDNIEKWALNVVAVLPDTLERKLIPSVISGFSNFKDLTASEAAGTLLNFASESESFDIKSLITPIGGGVWSVVKHIPSVLIATVISIVATCFMATGYDDIVNFFKRQMKPKNREALSMSKGILFSTLKNLIKAYGSIMLITFAELSVGLYILKFIGVYDSSYIFIIAAITAVVDIVPVLGTGTVMVPWALYSLINGNIALTIGLAVIYVVILVIRQVIEPKMVASKLGLPPVLTIAAMYIGTQLFGFIGLFLLPIILIMIKQLNDEGVLHLWKSEKEVTPEEKEEKESEKDNESEESEEAPEESE